MAIGRRRAHADLAEERRLFQALMDSVPDRVFFKGPTGEYVRVNRAMADALEVADPSDVVGRTGPQLLGDAAAEEDRDAEQAAMAHGAALVGPVAPDALLSGADRHAQSTRIPLHDDAGQAVGLVGITRDVTELVDAQNRLRALNAGLEARVELRVGAARGSRRA